jgi:hypothetical protein
MAGDGSPSDTGIAAMVQVLQLPRTSRTHVSSVVYKNARIAGRMKNGHQAGQLYLEHIQKFMTGHSKTLRVIFRC